MILASFLFQEAFSAAAAAAYSELDFSQLSKVVSFFPPPSFGVGW